MSVITAENNSAAFSCPHRVVKVQTHTHNRTTGDDHFSALSGADYANVGLQHRPLCQTTVHIDA